MRIDAGFVAMVVPLFAVANVVDDLDVCRSLEERMDFVVAHWGSRLASSMRQRQQRDYFGYST